MAEAAALKSQEQARRMRGAGPVAVSLAVHGLAALLLVLAFGHARLLPRPAVRALPAIVLDMEVPRPALAQAAPPPAPPRVERRMVRVALRAAQKPVAQFGDTPVTPVQSDEPAAAAPVAAIPAEAPAAPVEAAAAASGPAEPPPLLYLAEVSRLIRLRLDYPAQARQDKARGTALVHILLARDGTVLSVEVVHGAGHPALDTEAREVVLRIHKFPELPEYYARGESRFAIDQPIGFVGS